VRINALETKEKRALRILAYERERRRALPRREERKKHADPNLLQKDNKGGRKGIRMLRTFREEKCSRLLCFFAGRGQRRKRLVPPQLQKGGRWTVKGGTHYAPITETLERRTLFLGYKRKTRRLTGESARKKDTPGVTTCHQGNRQLCTKKNY